MLLSHPVTRTPGCRVLAGSLLAFLLYWLYARSRFIRDPGSIFFIPERAYDRFYLDTRLAQAEDLLARPLQYDHIRKAIETARRADGPCLCATVVTVKRQTSRSYVYSTIGSILAGLTQSERASLTLNLFFADLEPEQHEAFHDQHLLELVDNVLTYDSLGVTQAQKDQFAAMIGTSRLKDKSIHDYSMALNICLQQSGCPYIAVIEGDVVFADSWLARTYTSLKSLSPIKEWSDMRLFSEEGSMGWASSKVGGNHEALISMALDSVLLLGSLALWKSQPWTRNIVTVGALAVLSLLTIPAAVVLFYQSGKASVLPPRPGVHIDDHTGCCSQAMIFNRQHVVGLIEYLLNMIDRPKQYDLLTRDYAVVSGLLRYAQYPVMAQHIGRQSVNAESNGWSIWSMAFEQLDKAELARDHLSMARAIWGANVDLTPYYE